MILLHWPLFSWFQTFSCVDKEGILCYPEPSPEKLFFFKEQSKVKRSHEIEDLHIDSFGEDEDLVNEMNDVKQEFFTHGNYSAIIVEKAIIKNKWCPSLEENSTKKLFKG